MRSHTLRSHCKRLGVPFGHLKILRAAEPDTKSHHHGPKNLGVPFGHLKILRAAEPDTKSHHHGPKNLERARSL
jgi:hypothetical protein